MSKILCYLLVGISGQEAGQPGLVPTPRPELVGEPAEVRGRGGATLQQSGRRSVRPALRCRGQRQDHLLHKGTPHTTTEKKHGTFVIKNKSNWF